MSEGVDPRFEAELRRGAVQLVALHYLERRRYGYDLVRLLGAAGFRIEEGTLYPILRRFEKQGVLSAEWDTSGARPRKYYLLSEEGRRLKTEMLAAWTEARDATDAALRTGAEDADRREEASDPSAAASDAPDGTR
jgi:PadR family transcriptional regulator PadR